MRVVRGLRAEGVANTRRTTGGPISVEPRINDRIRVPEVRLVGPNGEQVGIVAIGDALRLAQEADLDLVEVAPDARPPVCKLMDYGKWKYENAQKAREARRNLVVAGVAAGGSQDSRRHDDDCLNHLRQ